MNLDEQIAEITVAFEHGIKAQKALYAIERTEGPQTHIEGYTLQEIIVHIINATKLSRYLCATLDRRRDELAAGW